MMHGPPCFRISAGMLSTPWWFAVFQHPCSLYTSSLRMGESPVSLFSTSSSLFTMLASVFLDCPYVMTGVVVVVVVIVVVSARFVLSHLMVGFLLVCNICTAPCSISSNVCGWLPYLLLRDWPSECQFLISVKFVFVCCRWISSFRVLKAVFLFSVLITQSISWNRSVV